MAMQQGGWYWNPQLKQALQYWGGKLFGTPQQGASGQAGQAPQALVQPSVAQFSRPIQAKTQAQAKGQPRPDIVGAANPVQQQPPQPAAQMQGQQQPYRITQKFGVHNPAIEVFSKGGINTGTDFGADPNTPAYIPQGRWKVMEAYNQAVKPGFIGNKENRGYGNSVMVQNLETGEKLRFSHLSSTPLQPGQEIGGGLVGFTGRTGNVTGPHLDLEYYGSGGQLADVTQSRYGNAIFSGQHSVNDLAYAGNNFTQGGQRAEGPIPAPQSFFSQGSPQQQTMDNEPLRKQLEGKLSSLREQLSGVQSQRQARRQPVENVYQNPYAEVPGALLEKEQERERKKREALGAFV